MLTDEKHALIRVNRPYKPGSTMFFVGEKYDTMYASITVVIRKVNDPEISEKGYRYRVVETYKKRGCPGGEVLQNKLCRSLKEARGMLKCLKSSPNMLKSRRTY